MKKFTKKEMKKDYFIVRNVFRFFTIESNVLRRKEGRNRQFFS